MVRGAMRKTLYPQDLLPVVPGCSPKDLSGATARKPWSDCRGVGVDSVFEVRERRWLVPPSESNMALPVA